MLTDNGREYSSNKYQFPEKKSGRLYSSCDFQRLIFKDYLKDILPLDTFESFLNSSIFNKTAFCLGEKQGMLVNDECSSWYNTVGKFFYHFGIGDAQHAH